MRSTGENEMNYLKLITQVTLILGMTLLFTVLIILGWIFIPIAALCRAYIKTDENLGKPYDGPIYHFTWPIMWLWDNQIDGIANRNYKQFSSLFKQITYWSASRNPVSNLRFVPILSFKINPAKVRFIGSFVNYMDLYKPESHKLVSKYFSKEPHWFFAWQGLYSCFYLRTKNREFLAGWKVYPKDIFGLEPTSYRFKSTGFGLQFKKVN
jgi:predicted PurR-regulated permease PerM